MKYFDANKEKLLVFLTNNFLPPVLTIAMFYKCRWQIEIFFKWIKQHPRIKSFYGTSENAVKTQIWIAIPIYVLVAIIKKHLNLDLSSTLFYRSSSVTLLRKFHLINCLQTSLTKIMINSKTTAPNN